MGHSPCRYRVDFLALARRFLDSGMVPFVWCMGTRWPLVMKRFLAIILCLMSDVHGRGAVQSRIARMTFDLTSCASQPLRPGMYLPRATLILAIPFRLLTHCYNEKASLDSNTAPVASTPHAISAARSPTQISVHVFFRAVLRARTAL
jgi:hypothetical protein